jgi:hypothetical protein
MTPEMTDDSSDRVTVSVDVKVRRGADLGEWEEALQTALNDAGVRAMTEILKRLDAAGESIDRDGRKLTSKGPVVKRYETPYGPADVPRLVYQSSKGGATYSPLDETAGLVLSATPRFARMVASKFAEFGSSRVQNDLAENHGRPLSRGYITKLAEAVALIAESFSDQTIYRLPDFEAPVEALVVAIDQVVMQTIRPAPAAATVATVGFYDREGKRRYVVYLADLLDSGKGPEARISEPGRLLSRLETELKRARGVLAEPGTTVGISGGQPWATAFLEKRAAVQFIDPAKVVDLFAEAASVFFERAWRPDEPAGDPEELTARRRWEMRRWVEHARDRILAPEGLATLIEEFRGWIDAVRDDPGRETIANVADLLERERDAGRMNYQEPRASHVVEDAGILADSARVMFGDRIGHPKFKIGLSAARAILILRELTRTPGRWEQFWAKVRGKEEGQIRRDLTDRSRSSPSRP